MPIYEYRCEQGHTFEVMQRMSDEPVAACSTCESPVQRVFHPVAVHFKGSGFYNTDYGKRKRGRDEGDGQGGGDSSGEAKKAGDGGSAGEGKSAGESKPSAGEGKNSSGTAGGSGDSGGSKAASPGS